MLSVYNPDADMEVRKDASKLGFDAIILQKNNIDGNLYSVYYVSKKNN